MAKSKRSISEAKAISILKAQGTVLAPQEAAAVLDFLYFLAEVFYNRHAEDL